MQLEKIFIPLKTEKIQADLYGNFKEPQISTIIMAHGLGGEKKCGLDPFAEFYAQLGYKVCVFDHRGFGESTCSIKNLVDKNSQLGDWGAVIQFLQQQFYIPTEKMILWGYSFSGGHVLTLASQQPFQAIISNFPHIDGLASLNLYPKKYLVSATWLSLQDLAQASFGKVTTMPVVAKDRFAILAGEDCYQGYYSIIPKNFDWDNAVPARIVAKIGLYRPTTVVHKINSPTLIIGAEKDSLIPINATRKAAKKIKNGKYKELPCGHFDLFHEPYKTEILNAHRAFLASIS